ncbi:hypothetical protein [Halobacteriovorax sp. RT-1-4]|uniref:hypothetical protein n=1 Tax=unclassified Halobacteriovorax TaxID=2639665 RepID=UPI0039999D62
MKFIMGLLLLLNFISCNQKNFILEEELAFTNNFQINELYQGSKGVYEPKNTWLLLFTFNDYCYFYKTPFNKSLGEYRVTKRSSGKCSFNDDAILSKEGISDFKMNLHVQDKIKLNLIIDGESVNYPLLNHTVSKKFSPFNNQLKKSYFDNVFVNGGLDYLKSKTLKSGTLCHGVNIECKDVVKYKCDLCEEGSYEVVDFNCAQGGSKFCGKDKCGTKNQPACPRGYKVLDTKFPSLCFNGSPAGFCFPGLSTFCNDEGILICL